MAGVRPLTRDDLPRLAELHLEGFPGERSRDDVEEFLADIMFDHPWVDDRMPSLGYADANGRLIGCVGVMPRRMMMNDRPLRIAISNNLLVDPGGQPAIAAFALLRALRASGADLIMGEASPSARNLCERLGWITVEARCQRWLRPLRPTALGVGLLEGWRLPSGAATLLRGMSRLPDALTARLPGSPLRVQPPAVQDPPLDAPRLLELIERVSRPFPLRPSYDEASLTWILETLRRTRRDQSLRGGVVTAPDGAAVGWYLYYSRPGSIARVLQLGAYEGQRERVLRHLFHDAWRNGNDAVTGQADPLWNEDLADATCVFQEGRSWLIAHATDPVLRGTLSTSAAFLSRLETEGWITFAF